MRTPLLTAHTAPYPCKQCGVTVRTVRTTTGDLITITNTPVPDGDIIPWPSSSPNGLAEARIITIPVHDSPTWERHHCG